MDVKLAGEFRYDVLDSDGNIIRSEGWQKNLILNQGLDFFGGANGNTFNQYCVIGSGNSAPTVTQTQLDAQVKKSLGEQETSSYSYAPREDNLYVTWVQRKYRFDGLNNVNITELGLVSQNASSTPFLMTRALLKDTLGNPTSITIKTGEILDVYYRLYKVTDVSDKTYTVNLTDDAGVVTPYNITVRAASVGGDRYVRFTTPNAATNSNAISHTSNDLVAITAFPSGTVYVPSVFYPAVYVAGQYKVNVSMSLPLDKANTPIRSIFLDGYLYIVQVRFGRVSDDAALSKTDKQSLIIPFEVSWGRYEGAL